MATANIIITLKNTVADPQGLTVKHGLESLGFNNIADVRMGKFVRITLNEKNKAKADACIKEMCQKLLANPIIEEYSVEIKE